MASIGERDIRTLSEAIFLSRDAASVEAFPALALEVTMLVVRSDLSGWNEVDPVHGTANAVMRPAMELTVERATARR